MSHQPNFQHQLNAYIRQNVNQAMASSSQHHPHHHHQDSISETADRAARQAVQNTFSPPGIIAPDVNVQVHTPFTPFGPGQTQSSCSTRNVNGGCSTSSTTTGPGYSYSYNYNYNYDPANWTSWINPANWFPNIQGSAEQAAEQKREEDAEAERQRQTSGDNHNNNNNMSFERFWGRYNGGAGGEGSSSNNAAGVGPAPGDRSLFFPSDEEVNISVINQAIKDHGINLKNAVNVKTVSGSINLAITPSPLPPTTRTKFRTLTTTSTSGSTAVDITTSLGPHLLSASHTSVSGSIKLTYPADFIGTIEITTLSGSYKINSELDDVRIINDTVEWKKGERKILAVKGSPDEGAVERGEYSVLRVGNKSGSVKISFERKPEVRGLTEEERRRVEREEQQRRDVGDGAGGGQEKGSKESREREGPAVTRAAVGAESQPPSFGQQQTPPGGDDLPPSYDQSEADNVLNHIAGSRN